MNAIWLKGRGRATEETGEVWWGWMERRGDTRRSHENRGRGVRRRDIARVSRKPNIDNAVFLTVNIPAKRHGGNKASIHTQLVMTSNTW